MILFKNCFKPWVLYLKKPRYVTGINFIEPALKIGTLVGMVQITGRKCYTTRSLRGETGRIIYRVSLITIFIWFINIAVIGGLLIVNYFENRSRENPKKLIPCFEHNYCYRELLDITAWIVLLFFLVKSLNMGYKLLQVLEKLKHMLKQHVFKINTATILQKYIIFLCIVAQVGLEVYFNRSKLRKIIFNLSFSLNNVQETFIITMLASIKKCYQNINIEVRQLAKVYRDGDLRKLMIMHWDLIDLVDEFDDLWAANMMTYFFSFISDAIFLVFYIIDINAEIHNLLLALFQNNINFIKIVMLCNVGTGITNQSQETLMQLERLRRKQSKILNNEKQATIEIFRIRILNRKCELTCKGFITVNLRLVSSIVGIVLTYWVILIQFNDEKKYHH